MLCSPCNKIFTANWKIGYTKFKKWGHTPRSYEAARDAGCHICNLIWEHLSYSGIHSPTEALADYSVTYTLRLLNAEWALHGGGEKWINIQELEDTTDLDPVEVSESREASSSVDEMKEILRTEPQRVLDGSVIFWPVLYFQGFSRQVTLPLEILTGK